MARAAPAAADRKGGARTLGGQGTPVERPTLSVVLACRDEERRLPVQLDALAAQEVEGWLDTVVVDDGSTDGTAALAETYADRLPGLIVVRTPPRGRSAALNTGVAASAGDAVVFVDGDDEVAPGYLAALQAALVEHRVVAARIDNDTLNPVRLRGSRPALQADGLAHEPQQPWPVAGGGTIGIRRATFDAVDGFDDAVAYAQDSDLSWRLALDGVAIAWVPEAVLRYRHRTTMAGTFQQARRYGRGGALLDHRFGSSLPWWTVVKRSVRLVLVARHLVGFASPRVRVAAAFEAGIRVGWLEGRLWPDRLYPPAALVSQLGAAEAGGRPAGEQHGPK
jgi:glycosyltransferase involved in cell wall biosynthesis